MGKIQNPILPGFNPDPSILRVEDDYYIAVSTFEWFPGVQIYHSKDLANWELIATPLNRVSQLDMRGNPSSGGIWAPCLSYCDGEFFLIYTDTKRWQDFSNDGHNYLVTTRDIKGDWSEPVYLNSSGFDPSLFHDDDGRKWLLNVKWNYRSDTNSFDGILLQEYSHKEKKLTGPIKNIFKGTPIALTEGPHVYKKNGYYYLLTAEGGTGYRHSVTLARSKQLDGPYEVHPNNPILTSYNNPNLLLQKAGHASMCEGPDGYWYMTHLCGRPLEKGKALQKLKDKNKLIDGKEIRGMCVLGRETSIQKFEWKEDNWLYHINGTNEPDEYIEIENVSIKDRKTEYIDTFEYDELPLYFQSLRIPKEKFASLKDRKGYLRLYGQESITSNFNQSLIARRQQSFSYVAETCLEYRPESVQQMAGLIIKYNEANQYYLRVTFDEKSNCRSIGIIELNDREFKMPLGSDEILIKDSVDKIYLRAEVEEEKLIFSISMDGIDYFEISMEFDMTILSDEYAEPMGFTGAFVGMACQDVSGRRLHVDFDYFRYIEK